MENNLIRSTTGLANRSDEDLYDYVETLLKKYCEVNESQIEQEHQALNQDLDTDIALLK